MAENTTDVKAIYGTPTDDAGEYQEDRVSVRGLDYGCTCTRSRYTIDECIVCITWFRSEYPQDYTIDIWLYSGDSVEEHDRYEGTIGRFGYAEFPMYYCPSGDGWCPKWWKFCFKVEGKTHDSMPAKHCCVFEIDLPNDPDESQIIIPVRLIITTSQKGDLDYDGTPTPADAAIALQLAATGAQNPAADVNDDGHITSLDALMILQAASGVISL